MRRLVASLMLLGLLSATAVVVQNDAAYAQKEKDKDSKDSKDSKDKKAPIKDKDHEELKDEWPKVTEGIVVKILKVDVEKKTADFEDGSGKKWTLNVTADTKFVGPQGGKSDSKIKDDRFTAGYTAKIVTDKAGKNLTEVNLAYRRKDKEKEKDKEEMKDEKKKDEKKKDDTKKDDPKKK